MKTEKLQSTSRIVAPEVLLANLSDQNAKLLVDMAGGLKPGQASKMWNDQNPDNPTTAQHCAMIKDRYRVQFSKIRSDVLKQVHTSVLSGALIMARDRLVESLLEYTGKGKQGSLTECLNALQGISKLYGDSIKELESLSPDSRPSSAQAVLKALKADSGEEGGIN